MLRFQYIRKNFWVIRAYKEIIFMDETTSDMWEIQSEIQQPKNLFYFLLPGNFLNQKTILQLLVQSARRQKFSSFMLFSEKIEIIEDFCKIFIKD